MNEIRGLSAENLAYVEEIYQSFLHDPSSVDSEWREVFSGWGAGASLVSQPTAPEGAYGGVSSLQYRADMLIRNYRVRGHIAAHVNPLADPPLPPPEIRLEHYGLTQADLELPITTDVFPDRLPHPLREVLERMQNTYCRSIGAQFMHIDDLAVREWLQQRMEGSENRTTLSREEQLRIFTGLTDAVTFEEFIQKKYVGAKRFSLEGGETLIPLLQFALDKAATQGTRQAVIGMAHRGRLNVLANIVGKDSRSIFREFEDNDPELFLGRGDVKYHIGYHNTFKAASGEAIQLSLAFNPSHLEFVNPVALGRTRAKQDRSGNPDSALAILIHGDAAFIGEGISQETLNLSELIGYAVGGALHVIVNNQIGFTTVPEEGRSSPYASDVAKMLQIPIFHVNGEDPEAVAQVVRLALDFRQTFARDVMIDMYCYRLHGHNEGDEPSFTLPVLYQQIRSHPSVRDSYLEHLLELGGITREEADRIAQVQREKLEAELSEARSDSFVRSPLPDQLEEIWHPYHGGTPEALDDPETGVELEKLLELGQAMSVVPEGFQIHPRLRRIWENRNAMLRGEEKLDWATAELLAWASLAVSGHRIRVSGQDSARGTFSQRHSALFDYQTGAAYRPLEHLSPDQAPVEILNSPLSEAGVMGFEYGYSLDYPEAFIGWEGQFGDFANVAQIYIDQFLAAAEDKWGLLSGLTLLLPHGLEGQGPEHSSARLERYLTLAAQDNFYVTYPTTAAQHFHLLRRQVVAPMRKPLVIMTPKGMLRDPRVSSELAEMSRGHFQKVLADPRPAGAAILCSGKVYYDLAQKRLETGREDVAILRLEQLYPFPAPELEAALNLAPGAPVVWVQEEPLNMGAWPYLRSRIGEKLLGKYPLSVVSRPESASPATGSASAHKLEQARLMEQAFHKIPASLKVEQ